MADRLVRLERESDTREANTRSEFWRPADLLPVPKKNQDTLDFRYVRVSIHNEMDNINLSQALRDGWEPVRKADYPELKVMNDFNTHAQFSDGVLIGGLLLCARPKEIGEARRQYAAEESIRQIRSVREQYMSDNDRRMKKFSESESSIKGYG